MIDVIDTAQSCHTDQSVHGTYEWVMWQMAMSHVTHGNELCDIYAWVMYCVMRWDIVNTWLMHKNTIHDSLSHVLCHEMRYSPLCIVMRYSPLCIVMRYSPLCIVIRLNQGEDESCDTYQRVMWHIPLRHVTHINASCRTYHESCHTPMSHVTHTNESCDT